MNYRLYNGDLKTDLEKHLRADQIELEKDEYHNTEEYVWVIDLNDDSYVYYDEYTRNLDFDYIKQYFEEHGKGICT